MKTLLNLYIDGEIKAVAKSKRINLSKLFEQTLRFELTREENQNKTKDEIIRDLELKIISLTTIVEDQKKEIEKLKKTTENPKMRIKPLGINI